MPFNYDKSKAKQNSTDFWASYSDLFSMLAFVFLMMYVYASINTSTSNFQQLQEYKKLAEENEVLRQKEKVYNTLTQQTLEEEATEEERKTYQELMNKLSLLQDKAREEKEDLRRRALENEKTEMALNKYQRMIRDIINVNVLAKSRIERREKIIAEKEDIIAKKTQEIEGLEQNLEENIAKLNESDARRAQIEEQLQAKVKELKASYKAQKITKAQLEKRIEEITQKTEAKVSQLEKEKQEISKKVFDLSKNLDRASSELAERTARAEQLQSQLEEMKSTNERQLAKEREEFEKKLAEQRLSADRRAQALEEFNKQAQEKAKHLNAQVAELEGKVKASAKELEKAKRIANARKELAKTIIENFKANGIDAQVDEKTGDVTISFQDSYFDTGKANLKVAMKETLKKLMPIYAKSLLGNKKTAEKVKAVEIIGFASPTFKGKFVDPESLSEEDRGAINFNMDLSYQRARSIFEYIFDTNKLKYDHQKQLLPLVKVTGRSYLAEEIKGRGIASGIDEKTFCQQFDCKKSQRVIIKFNLDE